MFLILDVPNVSRDMALARHVTFVHQNEGMGQQDDYVDLEGEEENEVASEISDYNKEQGTVSLRLLREYISRARRHHPVIPPDVAPYIVEAYVSLRIQNRPGKNNGKEGDQTTMTARQLLSILRLGQAL